MMLLGLALALAQLRRADVLWDALLPTW
eukprot:COSAG01_NODE_75795_length_192_cov_2118.010753_1_plen_27_part_01